MTRRKEVVWVDPRKEAWVAYLKTIGVVFPEPPKRPLLKRLIGGV